MFRNNLYTLLVECLKSVDHCFPSSDYKREGPSYGESEGESEQKGSYKIN